MLPQNSSGVTVPTDENDRAMLATLLGEASTPGEGIWGPDEYGRNAFNHQSRTLSDDDVFGEMLYMVFVVNNRLIDWGESRGYSSWKDVITKTSDFKGYKDGRKSIFPVTIRCRAIRPGGRDTITTRSIACSACTN